MEQQPDHLIAVGRISRTHGIKGQVRFYSYSGNLDTLRFAKELHAVLADGTGRTLLLDRLSGDGSKILLTFAGYDSVEKAHSLVSAELFLRREQLPEPEDDEFYWHDLIGLDLFLKDGHRLGKLCSLMETGANDVYVVRDEVSKREYLVPAIASVVEKIDLEKGQMIITPLEGLLDL